jgi:hypothetical protein
MKPGERPDTVVLRDVPLRWFEAGEGGDLETGLKQLMEETFGTVANVELRHEAHHGGESEPCQTPDCVDPMT